MAAVKKKRWFKIIAPKAFRNSIIGETPTTEAETLIGKNASINAMSVLNDPRKQNLRLTFKIKEVKADQAHTELLGYEMLQTHIKRFSRKGAEKIEDSFTAKSKDGETVRIKPVFTTRVKIANSLKTSLRKSLQAQVAAELQEKNYDDFVLEVLSSKTQRSIKDQLKKLYPVGIVEFKKIQKINA